MKIVYSLPHPSHRLEMRGAGHIVRANALLAALEDLGCEIVRDQAAHDTSRQAVKTYRQVVKKLIPTPIALYLRDQARVAFGRRYGQSLVEVVRQHQPDVILQTHIAYSLSGKIATEATGVPMVLDDVAPSWEEVEYGAGSARLAKRLHQQVTQTARLCVAVSKPMQRVLVADGIAPEKLVTVPNGFDRDAFVQNTDSVAVREQLGIPSERVVLVFVGSFQPYHHVEWLVEAFAQIVPKHDVHLLLVGDGRQRDEITRLVQERNLVEQVTMTGAVAHRDVPRYVQAADIAVVPAHTEYADPMKLYEYMAAGRAIVAPNQEAITDVGADARDLLTFEPENVDGLANTLVRLVEDTSLRLRLGSQARLTIAEAHTWHNRAETLLAAMEKLCR